jgi:hypothetical protein
MMPPPARPRLRFWVRLCLVLIAVVLVGVFALAIWLDPYKDGRVWLEGTHQQFGLPQCTFKDVTGLPCPSCGMTSSFALLMRADILRSLQANAVGTGLALALLITIPWCLASALRGRLLFIRSVEWVLLWFVIILTTSLLFRWLIVLADRFVTGR